MIKPLALAACALMLMGVEQQPLPQWAVHGTAPADGVTVGAYAQVTAPVTSVRLVLGVTARNHMSSLGPADLEPLVDALVAAGVRREDVQIPPYVTGLSKLPLVYVTVMVRDPQATQVRRGIGIITRFLLDTPTLWVATASLQTDSAVCHASEVQAQAAAIARAHENAQRLAQYAGITLGRAQGIDASSFGASCSRTFQIVYPSMIRPIDEYLSAPVSSAVRVHYAIAQ